MPDEERAEKSARILETLYGLPCYQDADLVLSYASYRSEADTSPLWEKAIADGKICFAPRVADKQMDFYRISGLHDLEPGFHGIPEPAGACSLSSYMDAQEAAGKLPKHILCLMPGAVFDMEKHRIGFGGGFYDRYLETTSFAMKHRGIAFTTVGLCFALQLVEEAPHASWDFCPDIIVTEEQIVR